MKTRMFGKKSLVTGVGLTAAAAVVGISSAFAAPAPGRFLKVSGTTATLTLISAYNNSTFGYNFDGYAKGKLVVSIPLGYTVRVVCTTAKTASVNHSCAITKKLSATKAAFPGAESKNPQTGLAPGQTGTFTFTASKKGTYKIICLVPGHGDAGMWDTLKVTKGGAPSIASK